MGNGLRPLLNSMQVDAFSYFGLMLDRIIEAPTNKELEDEAYREDAEQSEQYDAGRSECTGY